MPLKKNPLTPSTKSFLITLRLTTPASAADAWIDTIILGSGIATLIVSNSKINDTMEIFEALKKSGILLKDANVIVENESREQKKSRFIGMLLGTLVASLKVNLLASKGEIAMSQGLAVIRACEGAIRQDF